MGRFNNQGRGGGRASGRSEGGRGGRGNRAPREIKIDKKKYIFTTVGTTETQISSFKATVAKLIEHLGTVVTEYPQDVVSSIRAMKDVLPSEPTLKVSTDSDTAVATLENEAFKMTYVQAMSQFQQRKDMLAGNLHRTFHIIWSKFCDEKMRDKVRNLNDYETTIQDNPYKLLEVIEQLSHSPVEERLVLPYQLAWDLLAKLFLVKQDKKESLTDFHDRFKSYSATIKRYFGTELLDKYVTNLPEYDTSSATAQVDLKKNAWERMLSYGLLANADSERYDKLRSSLTEHYANGRDEFPTTLSLMRERMDVEVKKTRSNPRSDNHGGGNREKNRNTHQNNSDKEKATFTSFAQLAKGKFFCYCCGSPDHKSDKCAEKDTRPKEKWF